MTPEIKKRIEQIQRGEVPKGYKKTRIGIVPEEWVEVSLSTVIKPFCAYTEDLSTYPLYSLTIEDGVTEKTERYERSHLVKKENSYKIIRPNDFAYNPMNVRFGAVARHKGHSNVAVSGYYDIFYAIYPEDNEFLDSFLACDAMIKYYNKMSTGSLIEKQRVHFSEFIQFLLPLPSRIERQKIAEILAAQDKVIELKEKLLEEKKKQKKYLMQQLLTGKKRLPGFSGEWCKKALGDILVEGSKEPVNTDDFKKITVKLNFNGIEFANINRDMVDTRPFYIRKKNEIIIGKQNYFNGSVALVTEEFDGCICSNAIMSFSVNNENEKFVLSYISQLDFMKKHEMLANGTGQKELSEKDFLNFEIDLPNNNEQNAISDVLSSADKEISIIKESINHEVLKKKALMQLLLTGLARVNA